MFRKHQTGSKTLAIGAMIAIFLVILIIGCGGGGDTTNTTITNPTIGSIFVSPSSNTNLRTGESMTVSATVFKIDGTSVPDGTGVFFSTSNNSFTLSASISNTIGGIASITITAPQGTMLTTNIRASCGDKYSDSGTITTIPGTGSSSSSSSGSSSSSSSGGSSSSSSSSGGATYALNGQVTDRFTHVAISGATVVFNGSNYTTNASGNYSVTGIAAGTYSTTASMTGFSNKATTVAVSGNTTQNFAISPTPQSGKANLLVLVKNKTTGAVIVNATVALTPTAQNASTDANGEAVFRNIAVQSYSVNTSFAGYFINISTVSPTVDTTTETTVELIPQ